MIELIAGAFLVGQFVYHRLTDKPDNSRRSEFQVTLPRCEEGDVIPMLFGTCRVRNPNIAWSYVRGFAAGAGGDDTLLDLFLILGITMTDSETQVKRIWAGDAPMYGPGLSGIGFHDYQDGVGGPEANIPITGSGQGSGNLETLNGNSSQVLCNDGETTSDAFTIAGRSMLSVMGEDEISGYRGFACAFFYGGSGTAGFLVPYGSVPAYSFEVSTYAVSHSRLGTYGRVGSDVNPVNVIFDVLTGTHGKLGLPESAIDMDSFVAAQYTLHTESHGYSRALEDAQPAEEFLQSILEQIDGVLDIDPATAKVVIKLIRGDYDPSDEDFPHITRDNCTALVNFKIGSMSNTPNRVRIAYSDRDRNFAEASSTASSMATAVGQTGIVREAVLSYPGVQSSTLADTLADRELAARNRNITTCRAIVDRSFAGITRGTAVKLTYQSPDVAGQIFRVGNIDRGTLADGKIALDLISDVFYVHRDRTPRALPTPKALDRFGL